MRSVFLAICLCICCNAYAQEPEYVIYGDSLYEAQQLVEGAYELMDQRNYEAAIQKSVMAIQKAVTLREAYVALHKAYEGNRSSPQLMIENLRAGLKISREDQEFHYYLGNVFQNLKKLEEAIEHYTAAIDFSTDDAAVSPIRYSYFFNRATSYLKQREYAKSIPDFTATLERFPDHLGSHVNRGFAYFNVKDKANACKDWKQAEALGSKQVGKYISQYCN